MTYPITYGSGHMISFISFWTFIQSLKWLQLGGDNDWGALCPYFDMINHSHTIYNVEYWYNDVTKVRALRLFTA